MLEDAPENEEVISDLVDFIGEAKHLVAHNASFDKKFLYSELDYAGIDRSYDFLCSMKTLDLVAVNVVICLFSVA